MVNKKTISSIFIVPTLKIDREELKKNSFINAYIKDGAREIQYNNAVYLVFKPDNIDSFRSFLDNEYERTKQIIDDYDYEDGLVVLVYELDLKYKQDFELIKLSQYSKTSQEFQDLFPKVVKIMQGTLYKDEVSLQYRIFNKTEDLVKFWEDLLDVTFNKEQEVWSWFDEDNETLNLNKIKQLSI
jgi:hypothetical protein